jgi:hypothetical protein
LTVDRVQNFINKDLLQRKCAPEDEDGGDGQEDNVFVYSDNFLAQHGYERETGLSKATAYRYMTDPLVGCQFMKHSDQHESIRALEQRAKCLELWEAYELRCPICIHFDEEEDASWKAALSKGGKLHKKHMTPEWIEAIAQQKRREFEMDDKRYSE